MNTLLIKEKAKEAENKPSVIEADKVSANHFKLISDHEILKTFRYFKEMWNTIESENEEHISELMEGSDFPQTQAQSPFTFGVVVLLTLNALDRELSKRGFKTRKIQ